MKNPLNNNIPDTTSNTDDNEDEDLLGFKNSLIWLSIVSGLIAILSEAISSTIESGADDIGVSGYYNLFILYI